MCVIWYASCFFSSGTTEILVLHYQSNSCGFVSMWKVPFWYYCTYHLKIAGFTDFIWSWEELCIEDGTQFCYSSCVNTYMFKPWNPTHNIVCFKIYFSAKQCPIDFVQVPNCKHDLSVKKVIFCGKQQFKWIVNPKLIFFSFLDVIIYSSSMLFLNLWLVLLWNKKNCFVHVHY